MWRSTNYQNICRDRSKERSRFYFYPCPNSLVGKGERGMTKTHQVKGAPLPLWNAMLKAWGISIGVTLLATAIMARLILSGVLKGNTIGYIAMGIILISVIVGSVHGARSAGSRGAIAAVSNAGLYWLTLVILNALVCKGEYHGLWVTLFLALGGGISAFFMKFERKKKKTPWTRKRRTG